MAAKKKKTKKTKTKTAKKAKKAPARKAKKAPARKAKKSTKKAKRPIPKGPKRPAKKAVKAVAKKAPAKKAKPVAKKKQTVGEGNYAASRKFDKDQASFVEKNKAAIPTLGKEAEAALDGPEGDGLRNAEAAAAGRSRDTF